MDQREILQQLLNEAQKKKIKKEEFANEFLKLKRQSAKYKADKTYTTAVAQRPKNIKKNRYKDILPYDHSLVELSLITSDDDSTFINANFIKGVYGPRAYIATQGPLSTTVLDFWRMIWEYRVLVIVMACMEFEMGKKKCERYWAELGETPLQFGPFSISCEAEKKKSDYRIRTLKAKFNSEIRIIYQFHYKNWPDHDVPSSVDPILELIWDIRCYQEDHCAPVCVHCSAGCGRTGVICAIDYTWMLLKDGIIPENFSVFNLIQEMRTQRPSLVQTQEQYELVYSAVLELFKRHMDIIFDNHSGRKIEAEFSIPEQNLTVQADSCPSDLTINAMKDAKMTTQQGKQRAEEASADAPSFSFRTCEISAKEGLVLSSAKSSPLDLLELNCGCNKKAVITRNGQAKASPVMGEPLQKYQSLDLGSILFGSCPSAPPIINTAGGCPDSRRPVIRTKSTPFELIHQRKTNELDIEDGSSRLESQLHEPCLMGLQAPSAAHVSSEELNYSLPCASEHPAYDASDGPGALRVHSWMSLVEDPYFPSSPPNSADSKMSFDLPEKQDGATFPCALLPASSTTPFSYCNAHDSLTASPLTSLSPPLNQETATEATSPRTDEDEIPPPLPERTPESFIVAEEAGEFSASAAEPLPLMKMNTGALLEPSRTSESNIHNSVGLTPSKNVKLRSPASDRQQDDSPPPPLPERTLESFFLADEDCMQAQPMEAHSASSPETTESATSSKQTLKTPGKSFTRSKSLKIFRNMKKSVCNSSCPSKPTECVQPKNSSCFLNFGFGNRFSKPKGPRNPPSTWNI
ncbi:tyrosine-protein phosphatase non-receptor type 22 [Meriones unguiculatus]|uniref:tyrosine-protein phosphatase non-receptor type 22 n=1 Tax=Meriones unguiculatus TaxID=10047 RepID=UPI00293F7746|nr:tyrosine-protein phosphatase non-receptor type 22 [Meriones unguiculatus]XP_060248929.1 tyrosine-protein phosphatase non-receptor type 22 [Meriones unguiculatus]XP_060248930.1 tyrosine-protein phosphatase non-receptor type 22 [Meriones unguiculatus]